MTTHLAQIQLGSSGRRIRFMADLALLYVIPAQGPWLLLSALRGGDNDEVPSAF